MAYVLTAKVGNNDDLFPGILKLYVPPGSLVADVTWGKGVFWKQVAAGDYRILRSDLETACDVRCDAKRLPYPSGSLDAVVLDPPYMYVGGFRTLNERMKQYKNKERAVRDGIHGVTSVDAMYAEMMGDAYRVLRRHGVLIVKCMDQIMSGKRVLQHVTVVRIGEDLGMECDDIFVLVRKSQPMMRHKLQVHARVNHSYFVVFTKS